MGLLALALLLWGIGLVVKRQVRDAGVFPRREVAQPFAPGRESLELLASIVPPPGRRGCPRWRELARLGAPLPEASGELGFEALRLVFEHTDGDVHWRVGVLLDGADDPVRAVALRLECRPLGEQARSRVLGLAGEWPWRVEPLVGRDEPRDSWVVRWRDPWAAAELEGRTRSVLGGHLPVDVPGNLREDYELLLDPLRTLQFQPSGVEPARQNGGRQAVERLLASGREELVRNVLRGLDPEGRVFAIEALLERVRPLPEDAAAMRALLAMDTLVRATNATAGRARASDVLGLVAEVAQPGLLESER